jgi:hypothetical protein
VGFFCAKIFHCWILFLGVCRFDANTHLIQSMKNNFTPPSHLSFNETNELVALEKDIAISLQKSNCISAPMATLKSILWFEGSFEVKKSFMIGDIDIVAN